MSRRTHKMLIPAVLGKAGGSAPAALIPIGSRVVTLENSYGQHLDMGAHMFPLFMRLKGKLEVPAAGRRFLQGDRYDFATSLLPGFVAHVNEMMDENPAIIHINNYINNANAGQSVATMQGYRNAITDLIRAHPWYSNPGFFYISEVTVVAWWGMTSAQRAASDAFADWLVSLDGTDKNLITDLRLTGNTLNYAGSRDLTLHRNMTEADLNAQAIAAKWLPKIATDEAFPSVAPAASQTIVGITNANPGIINMPAHGRTKGEPFRIPSMSGMSGLALTNRVVGNVIDADHFEIQATDTTSLGTYTASSAQAQFGFYGDNGSGLSINGWSTLNGSAGATLATGKDMRHGREWQTISLIGTATAVADSRLLQSISGVFPAGSVTGGKGRICITDGTGTGPPQGLESLSLSLGSGTCGGATPANIITLSGTPTIGAVANFDFYNARLNPITTPMETDAVGYDATAGRIARVTYTVGSAVSATEATGLAAAITSQGTAYGITATASGSVVTWTMPWDKKQGTACKRPTGETGLTASISVTAGPFNAQVENEVFTSFGGGKPVDATSGVSNSLIFRSIVGDVSIKLWFADIRSGEQEDVPYAGARGHVITGLFTRPTCTLAASLATAQAGVWDGGRLKKGNGLTWKWYRNNTATNPTPNSDPTIDNPEINASGWEFITSTTVNTYDATSQTGHYLIFGVYGDNGLPVTTTDHIWSSKTTGTVP